VARRTIGFPLALGIVLCVLALTLGIGWQLIVVGDLGPVTRGLTRIHWLLIILGSLFFVLIIVGLLLLCLWLVREIRSGQQQQAFLDAVTHEMKTPLAALRLYLETLERRDVDAAQRRRFLSRMALDVERLDRTVSQVLAAARAEGRAAGRARGEPVALGALIERIAEDIRRRHALAEDAICIAHAGAPAARGAEDELGVVFRNLLDNAVKYSEPPVRVSVRIAEADGGRVAVEITDRGIGIGRRELNKIFRRFYRAGAVRPMAGELGKQVFRQAGLGLGLFIVRSLVRRGGGNVEARSEGEGRGSRFRVLLPAAETAQPTPASLRAAPGAGD